MSRKSLVSGFFQPRTDARNRRKTSRRRRDSSTRGTHSLRIETLENRRLLAVTVGNESDVVDGDVSSIAALVADSGSDGISLREAIVAANNTAGADEIDFAPGVKGTISLTNGQLDITDDLTINGPGTGRLTVSGSGETRVFDVNETSLAVNHLTIADGFTTQDLADESLNGTAGGAGIRATASSVSLQHVVLEDNQVVDSVFAAGAAMQGREGSSLSLDHVTVRNNEATGLWFTTGGAVQNDQGSLTVTHSTFEGNRATNHDANTFLTVSGGAIGVSGGSASVSDSRFVGNQVDGNNFRGTGGAISSSSGNALVVDHSAFMGNSAVGVTAEGGAISNDFNFMVPIQISHSRFISNSAVADGGYAQGGAVSLSRLSSGTIASSQFVRNTVSSEVSAVGGAIANTTGSTLTVDSSSIVNNRVISPGDALGGGIYNDGLFTSIYNGYLKGTSNVSLTGSNVNANRADGGNGVGGGVYDAGNAEVDTFFTDDSSPVKGNKASTSHDDVFGDLALLSDLLSPI